MKVFIKWLSRAGIIIFPLLIFAIAAVKAFGPTAEEIHGHPFPESPPEGIHDEFLATGEHRGRLASGAVIWRSSLTKSGFELEEGQSLILAAPMSADTAILEVDPVGIEPVRNRRGEVVALELPKDAAFQERFHLVVRQPFEEGQALTPPLIAGRTLQRVTLEGLRFTPHRESIVERHSSYLAQKGITDEQIEWADERLEEPTESTGRPIFVRPDRGFFDGGGLAGHVVSENTHRRERLALLTGGFAGAVIVIGLALHLLSTRARHEEADAFLEAFDDA